MTEMKVTLVERLTHRMAAASQHTETPLTERQVQQLFEKMLGALTADEQQLVTAAADAAVKDAAMNQRPEVTEIRPKELECDVVRFQNNKDKWVALVGLLNGYPYEIFTGLQDDEEGICRRSSIRNTGTMPSLSVVCCATACLSNMSSSSSRRCSCSRRASIHGRTAWSVP